MCPRARAKWGLPPLRTKVIARRRSAGACCVADVAAILGGANPSRYAQAVFAAWNPAQPEISDLIIQHDPATLARVPVRKRDVLEVFARFRNKQAMRVVEALPEHDGFLDDAAVLQMRSLGVISPCCTRKPPLFILAKNTGVYPELRVAGNKLSSVAACPIRSGPVLGNSHFLSSFSGALRQKPRCISAPLCRAIAASVLHHDCEIARVQSWSSATNHETGSRNTNHGTLPAWPDYCDGRYEGVAAKRLPISRPATFNRSYGQ